MSLITKCLIFLILIITVVNPVYADTPTPTPSDITPTVTPTPTPTPSDNSSDKESERLNDLQNEINELQSKITVLQKQGETLSSQIKVMDSQIKLTELRINATKQKLAVLEEDIDKTNKKITRLERSLTDITKVLLNRIVVTYEVGRVQPLGVLLSSNDIVDFFKRANYLKVAQAHDKKLLFETQQARNDYANQKAIFEEKKNKVVTLKKQLEGYTAQLDQEKKSKESLLDATRNDEKRYQDLLAKARSEFEAIQGIISGKGQETLIGDVSEGQKIATVISGSSCNSGGSHLHFIVSRNGSTENPFSYLRGGIDFENCSGFSCGSGDADPFNPSGDWMWPIDPKIRLNQGYGATWATRNTWVGRVYSFHNGIDIDGSSPDVKAVKDGTLYQGSYTGSGGCRLRYVKVKHKDSGFETFYLHVNYIL